LVLGQVGSGAVSCVMAPVLGQAFVVGECDQGCSEETAYGCVGVRRVVHVSALQVAPEACSATLSGEFVVFRADGLCLVGTAAWDVIETGHGSGRTDEIEVLAVDAVCGRRSRGKRAYNMS